MMRLLLMVCVVTVSRAEPSLAEKLIESGHWKRARAVVEARLRESPNDAASHFFLSQIRGAFGDRATPLPLAEKAVALDPRAAKYHRQIAEVLGVAAQRAGALQQLFLARRFRKEIELALSLDPRDPQAQRDLMEFYLLAPGIAGGDTRKASEMAAQIATLDAVEGLLAKARIAEHQKQPGTREALLRQAADTQPPRYKALITLARFYLEGSAPNFDAAETRAKIALALERTRVDAYAILAAIYAARGEWNALDSTLETASREVPDDLSPNFRAAERLLAIHREPTRAERYLRAYLAQDAEGNQPSAAETRLKLGLTLDAQGRATEALAEFKESLRLDPESGAALEIKRLRNPRTLAEPATARSR